MLEEIREDINLKIYVFTCFLLVINEYKLFMNFQVIEFLFICSVMFTVSSLTCPLKCGGRPCTTTGECCNEQCLGGCTGPTPKDCFVCKKVEHEIQDENLPRGFERVCMSACPDSTYEVIFILYDYIYIICYFIY